MKNLVASESLYSMIAYFHPEWVDGPVPHIDPFGPLVKEQIQVNLLNLIAKSMANGTHKQHLETVSKEMFQSHGFKPSNCSNAKSQMEALNNRIAGASNPAEIHQIELEQVRLIKANPRCNLTPE